MKTKTREQKKEYQQAIYMFKENPLSYEILKSHYVNRYGRDRFINKLESQTSR